MLTWPDSGAQATIQSLSRSRPTAIAFLAPLCERCQEFVESLNELARAYEGSVQLAAVLTGQESACRSFLRLFPLDFPSTFDADGSIVRRLGIVNRPLVLLYSDRGTLERKWIAVGTETLNELRKEVDRRSYPQLLTDDANRSPGQAPG